MKAASERIAARSASGRSAEPSARTKKVCPPTLIAGRCCCGCPAGGGGCCGGPPPAAATSMPRPASTSLAGGSSTSADHDIAAISTASVQPPIVPPTDESRGCLGGGWPRTTLSVTSSPAAFMAVTVRRKPSGPSPSTCVM